MKDGHFSPGLAYVAFSRVKSLNGLHLLNFNPAAINCSTKVKEEMQRLATKLLPPLQKAKCMSLPKPIYTTIALLNIRSLQPKLPDIAQDPITHVVDIFCLTETWLSPSHPPPSLKPDHNVFRCDRSTQNNKGGVLISAPKAYCPVQTQISVQSRIECVSVRLVLPNQCNLLVLVLYRPPSQNLDIFLGNLLQILQSMCTCASHLPSIVVRDFNEDINSSQYARIKDLFTTFAFSQYTNQLQIVEHVLIIHILTHLVVTS